MGDGPINQVASIGMGGGCHTSFSIMSIFLWCHLSSIFFLPLDFRFYGTNFVVLILPGVGQHM